jgi:hypothetical protein
MTAEDDAGVQAAEHCADENDEVSRLEGSPARSEKMLSDCDSEEVGAGVNLCSLSSLLQPTAPSISQEEEEEEEEEEESSKQEHKEAGAQQSSTPPAPTPDPSPAPAPSVLVVKTPEESDVGRQVEVFWPQENSWYCGLIDKFRDARGVVVREMPSSSPEEEQEQEQGGTPLETEVKTAEGGGEVQESVVDAVVVSEESVPLVKELDTDNAASSSSPPASTTTTPCLVSYHISYVDGDDEWIDGDDLKALVFADASPEEKAQRHASVEAALASLIPKKKKARAPRKPKAVKEGSTSGSTSSSSSGEPGKGKGRGKAKGRAAKMPVAAAVVPAKPLPPDVLLRVSLNEKKMSALLLDLAATRDLLLHHHRRRYDDTVASRQQPLQLSAAAPVADEEEGKQQTEEVAPPPPAAPPLGFDETSVQQLIALAVRDSSRPLSALVDSLTAALRPLLAEAPGAPGTADGAAHDGAAPWHAKYLESVPLTEYIKSIATRTTYGFRSPAEVKLTSLFEDEAPLALWRWEVMKTSATEDLCPPPPPPTATTPTAGDADADKAARREAFQVSEAMKTIKNDYQRAGKVVKAVQRVIAELHKAAATSTLTAAAKAKAVMVGESTLDAASEVTIAGLEDKVTKCQMEVQKAAERKLQVEKKWESSVEESENKERKRKEEAERRLLMQSKKQELQQAQQQLKLSKAAATEEAKHAKAAMAALLSENKRKAREEGEEEVNASKKKPKGKVLSEKELKAQSGLAKQKSLMSSFFKAPPSAPASASTSTITSTATSSVGVCEGGSSTSVATSSGKSSDEASSPTPESLPSPPSSSEGSRDGSPQRPIVLADSNIVDLTSSASDTTPATAPSKVLPTRKPQRLTAAAIRIQAARELRPLDVEQFEHSIAPSTPFSMGDISRLYRSRYSEQEGAAGGGFSVARGKRKLRKPVQLSITVTGEQQPVFVPGEGFRGPSAFEMAMGGGGQAAGGYSEQKQVQVDSRKRLLSFSEDLRPPYYGTWSKRSLEVTGRRPFAKDLSNSIDYDVDSEAEWEEEEEGEDIIMSDDEDEVEGNDMVFDEFFCPDDEIVYADPRGGDDDPDPSGGKGGGADSVNAIFTAMQARGGQGGGERELQSCIAGVHFFSAEDRRTPGGDLDVAQLSRYSAVVDPCAYWSPLPVEKGGSVTDVQTLSPMSVRLVTHPPLVLSTPSLVAAAQTTARAPNGGNKNADAKKERSEKKEYYRQFQNELIPCLASFLQGKKGGVDKMVEGFTSLWRSSEGAGGEASSAPEESQQLPPPSSFPVPPSKTQIKAKIKEIAQIGGNKRWSVRAEVLATCPPEVAQSLANRLVALIPEPDSKERAAGGGAGAGGGQNKVLSFPVVSATAAIESMSNVPLPSSTAPPSSLSAAAAAVSATAAVAGASSACANTSAASASLTPCKDKEKQDKESAPGPCQPSLLRFFGKPRPTLTSPSSCGVAVIDASVEEEEEFSEAQRGISWWGESKSGSPAPLSRKRALEEVDCAAVVPVDARDVTEEERGEERDIDLQQSQSKKQKS